MTDLKKKTLDLIETHKIKVVELCRFAGVNDKYLYSNEIRPCIYHSAICLVAKKKGVNLEAILNIKDDK